MNKNLEKIKIVLKKQWVRSALVFCFFFLTASFVYLTVDRLASLDDPLFHIRFAQMLRNNGYGEFSNFPWIYFSKMAHPQVYFIYYNFLFYAFLSLFTFFTPLFFGLKIYGVIMASSVFTILYVFLRKMNQKASFVWTLLFFVLYNTGHLVRFFMARPFTLAPALLLIELYLLYKKKYFWIFVLGIFYFFWHTATFFFVPVVAGLYFLFENFYGKKLDLKIIVSSFSAVLVSIIIANRITVGLFLYMKDIIFGVFTDTIIGKTVNIPEGGELYGVNVFDFTKSNQEVMVFLVVCIVLELFRYIYNKRGKFEYEESEKDILPVRGTLFFLSIFFLLGTFISGRNMDFFVFFASAYTAISGNDILRFIDIKESIFKIALPVGLLVAFVYLYFTAVLSIQGSFASAGRPEAFEGSALWLEKNTPQNSIVFNANWGWFPPLFYYNQNNYYVTGIEPRFLYDYNQKLYWKWYNIASFGFVCEEPVCGELNDLQDKTLAGTEGAQKNWYENQGKQIAETLRNDFKSEYVISSVEYKKLNDVLEKSNHFEKVYSDPKDNPFLVYKTIQ